MRHDWATRRLGDRRLGDKMFAVLVDRHLGDTIGRQDVWATDIWETFWATIYRIGPYTFIRHNHGSIEKKIN